MNINDLNASDYEEVGKTPTSMNINNLNVSDYEVVNNTSTPEDIVPELINTEDTNTSPFEEIIPITANDTIDTVDSASLELDAEGKPLTIEQAGVEQALPVLGGVQSTIANLVGEGAANIGMYFAGEVMDEDFKKSHPTLSTAIEVTSGIAAAMATGDVKEIGKQLHPQSRGAKYMDALNKGRITKEEFASSIEEIPTNEQAILLAEGNKLYKEYFKGAINKHDMAAADLGRRLELRKGVIDTFSANKDEMNIASEAFSSMRKELKAQVPDTFTTSGIKDNVSALDKIYSTDATPLGTTIRSILVDIGDEMDIDTALDIRENINAMIRKSSVSKNAKGNLGNIKDNIDSFISVALRDRPDLLQMKDIAIDSYRETINNFQFGELIKKNTKNDYAVNWRGLRTDVKKNKLSSSKLDYAKPILQDFEKRFVNDKSLGNLIVPSGAGKSNLLSLVSDVYSGIIDIGHRALRTDRAHGLVIQDEIRKSVTNKNNIKYEDFINDILTNKKIPEDIKSNLKTQ